MAGLLISTFRIPGFHQLAELFPKHIASLRDRLHRGDREVQTTIIKLKFEPEDLLNIEMIVWLQSQSIFPRIAWQNREGNYQFAGVGRATGFPDTSTSSVNNFTELSSVLSGNGLEYLRFFGGMAFDLESPGDPEWQTFGACQFVAPMFHFEIEDGQPRFIAQIVSDGKIAPTLDRLLTEFLTLNWTSTNSSNAKLSLESVLEVPTHSDWRQEHKQVLDEIGQMDYEKVVLARKLACRTIEPFSPLQIFHRLSESNINSFNFYFEFEKDHAFLGASPERLFMIQEHDLYSEALAGTRPRGDSEIESKQFETALLASDKDQREHGIVFDELRERFERLAEDVRFDNQIGILEQTFVQHLHQTISGKLKNSVGITEVLSALHPTPALGGHPQKAALQAISKHEGFYRGWYGGPVGWIQGNQAEFAVGIRSALCVDEHRINLYAGVGIVAGSEAEAEWLEMKQKLRVWEASLAL